MFCFAFCVFVCYPLWRNVCSDPLPIFYLAICLFMVELKSSLCILDTSCPYRSAICKYFLSFFGLAFHSLSLRCLVNYIHSLCHDFQDARVSAPLLSGDNLIPCQAGLLSLGCHSRPTPGLFPFHNVPCSLLFRIVPSLPRLPVVASLHTDSSVHFTQIIQGFLDHIIYDISLYADFLCSLTT